MYEIEYQLDPVRYTITPKMIADLMVGAFESSSGSLYWVESIEYKKIPPEVVPNGVVTYSHPEFWGGDFELVIESNQGRKKDRKITLTPASIKKAIDLMVQPAYRSHLTAWMTESDDAETSDVFLQLCCFGEVIYG